MFCSECGQHNADDAKFCMKCGKKFVIVATQATPSIEPPPPDPVSPDSDKARSSSPETSVSYVSTELKDSGAVTAMSVIGLVFGLIGMLGSFIPCIGSFAFFIGIPAALISGIALGVAYSQKAKRTFAIVALTISLIGVVISGWQYLSIISAGHQAKQELDKWSKQSTTMPTPSPTPAPAPARRQDQVSSSTQIANAPIVSDNEALKGKYPEGSTRLLTSADLENKSLNELKIMRNEIFARHGYIFKTDDMKKYFSSQAWYTPKHSDVSNLLNKIEIENVNIIKNHERTVR